MSYTDDERIRASIGQNAERCTYSLSVTTPKKSFMTS